MVNHFQADIYVLSFTKCVVKNFSVALTVLSLTVFEALF